MNDTSGPRAVFGVEKRDIPGVQQRSMAMYNGFMANAATLSAPPIQMAAFLVLVSALSVSQQTVTETRSKGSPKTRNSKRNAVWTAMLALQAYLQGFCNSLNPDDAAALILAAGMVVGKVGTYAKPVLAATLGVVQGDVHLEANRKLLVGTEDAAKKLFFNWGMSTDGGKSWSTLPSTPYARTDVTGLALLSTYTFRVSVTVGTVTGAWSQAVSVLVH